MTHTPAPWMLDAQKYSHLTRLGDNFHIIEAGDELASKAPGVTGFRIHAFIPLADAHLIAAAPDLLAAAKSIAEKLKLDNDEWVDELDTLVGAISKAEGNT